MIVRSSDFNIRRIANTAFMVEMVRILNDVYVCGLADRPDRPDIMIWSDRPCPPGLGLALDVLSDAGLTTQFVIEPPDVTRNNWHIRIGLSFRLRMDLSVSKRILKTLILGLENLLLIDVELKITPKATLAVGGA